MTERISQTLEPEIITANNDGYQTNVLRMNVSELLGNKQSRAKIYSQTETAELFGATTVDEKKKLADSIRKNWYPQVCKIYEAFTEEEHTKLFRVGPDYTELAISEFEMWQRFRHAQYPIRLFENGKFVGIKRYLPLEGKEVGQPIMSDEIEPVTVREYRAMRWEECPELKRSLENDSVQQSSQIVKVEVCEAHNLAFNEDFSEALEGFEEVGFSLANLLDKCDQAADVLGDKLAGRFASRLQKRVSKKVGELSNTIATSLGA